MKIRKLLLPIPEIYFMVLLIWWTFYIYFSDPYLVNYPALIAMVLFGVLLFTKNKILGLSLSVLSGLISFYLIFALLSDLRHIIAFDGRTVVFLLKAGALIISAFTISIVMFLKYLRLDPRKNFRH